MIFCSRLTFTAAHVPRVENKIADTSSRFHWQEFRQLALEAHSSPCSAPAGQLNTFPLEQRCLHFWAQGLAPSRQKAYASGRCKFVEFCCQAGKLQPNGSPCPADECTLCLFVSFLADSNHHSSIKVYLSAVCSLHIEQGFPDPLLNCLQFQQVLRAVKYSQGSLAA